jgi:hypothetical protein
MDQNRREVLAGAAGLFAAASVPVASVLAKVAVPDPDDLGIFVGGCGRACDCGWWLRSECAFGRWVRKLGDRFIIYDMDNNVVGEAEPGFSPTPQDAEWVAKVEFAREHNIPHPYDWPLEAHESW